MQMVRSENTKVSGNLSLKSKGERVTVRVTGDMLSKITEGDVNAATLLFARPFDVKYNEFRMVTSVSRQYTT